MLLKDRLRLIEQATDTLLRLRPCELCRWYVLVDPVLNISREGDCNYGIMNCGSESNSDSCDGLHQLWESDVVLDTETPLFVPSGEALIQLLGEHGTYGVFEYALSHSYMHSFTHEDTGDSFVLTVTLQGEGFFELSGQIMECGRIESLGITTANNRDLEWIKQIAETLFVQQLIPTKKELQLRVHALLSAVTLSIMK